MSASHPPHHAASAAFFDRASDTPSSETGRSGSGNRAKALPLGNPLMHARRIRAVRVLVEVLGAEKEIVRACMLGVSRALVARWLSRDAVDKNPAPLGISRDAVDKNPAPLGILWALDDETFNRLIEAVRADRRAQSEGR